ncbi:ATP-binding protein [Lacinutrix sp. MedPE-SW]|uniref:tetratricopeptide repeat-containing hybrid sensor histidine kinase/response regulator n=1 Tax=Lacinutrix sp. MedPE-SW TaxID=1860087 RepID=UPI00092206D9|nr:ATP-binding protein [Lacinutrix sp. MedPE-SW]OIQ22679.1 MAG: hypothetical protein BM549_06255 [Lacinutrix sp. MedPE-SW]
MLTSKKTFLFLLFVIKFSLGLCQKASDQDDFILNIPEGEITKAFIDTTLKEVRNYYYSNNYAKAINNGETLLNLARQIGYSRAAYKISSIIGNSFLQTNDTVAAKRMFLRELELAEKRNDSAIYLGASIDLGNIYFYNKKYSEAIKSYKGAIPYAQKSKDSVSLFILNYNISDGYLNKFEVENAKPFVKKLDNYIVAAKAKPYQAGYFEIVGRYYVLNNEPKKAIPHLVKSIDISKSIDYTDNLVNAYTYYAKAEANLGNYKKAFNLQKEVDYYKEKKYGIDKIAAIESESARFKLKEYQQEINKKALDNARIEEEASRSKKIMLWLIVGSTALLLSFGLLFMSYRKRKKLLLDLEQKNKEYLYAKQESEAYARAKSNFFSNISHELRTPLYGIIGISSILMDDKNIVEKHKEDVKSLKFSADYLLALINDVLQITKLDATQETNLNKITFNLEDLINGIMKSFEFLKAQNMNTFKINISKNTPLVLIGDDVKLSQILINLIGNACKFTENGTITLDINTETISNNTVKLNFVVKDTGIGIPKSKQEAIFDEFTQIEKEGGELLGTGLGLPIVKKLIELHQSKIYLESDEGKGTTISFSLNYDVANQSQNSVSTINVQSKISINNKRILVVDDNRINRIVTRKILEKYKAKPLLAETGPEAITLTKANKVDLILMDINMPGMNGLEATEAIRKFNVNVPIIALTAVEIEEMRESIKNSSICDIIIKPYDEIVFIETILKHI